MATIQYSDGTKIEFTGTPSQQDIESAYNNVKGISTQQTPEQQLMSGSFGQSVNKAKEYGQAVQESAKAGINQIKQGFEQTQNAGFNPIKLLEGGITGGAGIINTVLSPIAPIFSPINKGIGSVANKVSNLPEVQQFANSGVGHLSSRVAENISNLSTIAGTIGGAIEASLPKPKTSIVGPTTPIETVVKDNVSQTTPKPVIKLIANRTNELSKLDTQYSALRKFNQYSTDNGVSTRARIASTDILDGAVDETGTIRTTQPGGPIDQYKAQTLDNAEGLVKNLLTKEGGKTNLGEVQIRLEDAINNSGLQGADLKVALNKVKQEISGLKLKADQNGDIPNSLLQDAKINTYNNINFQTPPEVSTYRKAIANGYKTLIEKNSSLNIKDINAELAKYLKDIEYLKLLDGKKVQGGKLGKYFAQISGNLIGGATGSAVGGPVGSAIGTVVGGEIAGRIKGNTLSKTFGGDSGLVAPKNPILENAINQSQSNNLGNLNQQYNPTNMTNTTDIGTTVAQKKGIIQSAVDKYKSIPNKQSGFVKVGGKEFREIPEATKKEMIQVIDYLNLKKPVSKNMEYTISKLLPKYNINQDWSNSKIADTLSSLVENTKTK